jgi:hypothetical protein
MYYIMSAKSTWLYGVNPVREAPKKGNAVITVEHTKKIIPNSEELK